MDEIVFGGIIFENVALALEASLVDLNLQRSYLIDILRIQFVWRNHGCVTFVSYIPNILCEMSYSIKNDGFLFKSY